jgi:hypothetical protein
VGWVRLKRECLLTLAYYAFSRYEYGERRWNDVLTGENRRTRRKTCPSATLSTTNATWIDPGANQGLRGERPATNDLSHGTALYATYYTMHIMQIFIARGPMIMSVPRVYENLNPALGRPAANHFSGVTNVTINDIWGSHGDEHVDVALLGSNATWTCR